MAEDIARAQGCSEVFELLAKLSSVSKLVFLIRQFRNTLQERLQLVIVDVPSMEQIEEVKSFPSQYA